ncbi:hypothetical protein [Paenibacillus castaneae]|uniref:hypothetical protein n=1 Tax=Paenibacillus castaneae TaxID=474957 RepID=UPI001ABA6745|nr:hypothetical protein [Paenibacillus castaneae]
MLAISHASGGYELLRRKLDRIELETSSIPQTGVVSGEIRMDVIVAIIINFDPASESRTIEQMAD